MDNSPVTNPQQNPEVVEQPKASGGGKIFLWIILALLAIVIIGGGAYWYMMSPSASKGQPANQAPATAPESSLDSELNTIDVQASEGTEFDALDKDLQSL